MANKSGSRFEGEVALSVEETKIKFSIYVYISSCSIFGWSRMLNAECFGGRYIFYCEILTKH